MDKIVYIPQGTGTALDNLNELLQKGWIIVSIHTIADSNNAGCFVWIKKDKENN